MSAQLVARGVAASHGARPLFSDLDLTVAPGAIVGLVGPNGAGKSTLLRMLAGLEPPGAGTVECTPATATVGLLPQERTARTGETVLGHLGRRTGVDDAASALDAATAALAAGESDAADRYDVALQRWLALGGADLPERAAAVTAQLGLDVELTREVRSLSGGQAARAALASLLLSRYDVLLLDEPTNDLDLAGLEQLEEFVRGRQGGVVVVSHDREFLARTVTEVVELDLHQQAVRHFGGGYDAYVVERERERARERERYEEYAARRDELTSRSRMQREWAAKGVRTARRDTSERDKFIRHHRIATSEQVAAKARRTDRQLERLEVVEEPRREWELRMQIAAAGPSGRVVATLREVEVRRGAFRLGPVTLQVDRGDRVAITGPNGSGKSTLLGVLLGRIEPDAGAATLGASVRIGEVDQAREAFAGEGTVLGSMQRELPDAAQHELRTLLAKFGLGGEHVERPADTLSPGERTRAALALLQARGVNLLVLDEPTNHLDLPAIEQLESALESFDGTLLLVTHDRRMLSRTRVTRRVELSEGTVREPPL